jgi:hypothetical protein
MKIGEDNYSSLHRTKLSLPFIRRLNIMLLVPNLGHQALLSIDPLYTEYIL